MKTGYELELLAPPGKTRLTVAQSFAESMKLSLRAIFHRESERWPISDPKSPSYYCLTKGFELRNQARWQLRFINDMTIRFGLDPDRPEAADWYHLLTDDIRFIDLIQTQCDANASTSEILKPIADIFKSVIAESVDSYSVIGNRSGLVARAHSAMTDRNRICEIVTAPIEESHAARLDEIISLTKAIGCTVPHEGAFHIHFDGAAFATSRELLRAIRYFHVWSDVLKTIIPPNPFCTRLGGYSPAIVNYVFSRENEKKPFDQIVEELKQLGPTKYCDFNFNNILVGDSDKLTFEVRVIPMLLDATALISASDFYTSFMKFILRTNVEYTQKKYEPNPANIEALLHSL